MKRILFILSVLCSITAFGQKVLTVNVGGVGGGGGGVGDLTNVLNFNPKPDVGLVFNPNDSIIFIGDSYTFGKLSSTNAKRWTSLVATWLNVKEDNRGVSSTTLQKRTPIDRWASPNGVDAADNIPVKTFRKKLLVIAYGLNDIGMRGIGQYTPENYLADGNTVIAKAKAKGWPAENILIIGPYWMGQAGYNFYNANLSGSIKADIAWHKQYVESARSIARQNGTMFIDMYGNQLRNDTTLMGDAVHPTDSGHAYIAKVVYGYLTGSMYNPASLAGGGVAPSLGDTSTYMADSLTGVVGVYAMVKAVRSYSGPLVRIKRESDGAEQDIYADASGHLDAAAIASFSSGTNWYLAARYNQLGDGKDMLATVVGTRPRGYLSDGPMSPGGRPYAFYDGGDYMQYAGNICGPEVTVFSFVRMINAAGTTNPSSNIFFDATSTTSMSGSSGVRLSNYGGQAQWGTSVASGVGSYVQAANTENGVWRVHVGRKSPTGRTRFIDGVIVASDTEAGVNVYNSVNYNRIGAGLSSSATPTAFHNGGEAITIVVNAAVSDTDVQKVTAKIKKYYGL